MGNRYVVRDITKRISNADRLSDVLLPENYAMKGQWAEEVAMYQLRDTNNNQLRKFFTDIKTVESHLSETNDFDKYKREVWLLVPKIAYAAGRNLVNKDFFNLIKKCQNILELNPHSPLLPSEKGASTLV